MSKRIFTQEVVTSIIPELAASGMNAAQIAEKIGSTPGSVRVMCSEHKITLKRLKPGPRRRELAQVE
jgi:hypothetical protein